MMMSSLWTTGSCYMAFLVAVSTLNLHLSQLCAPPQRVTQLGFGFAGWPPSILRFGALRAWVWADLVYLLLPTDILHLPLRCFKRQEQFVGLVVGGLTRRRCCDFSLAIRRSLIISSSLAWSLKLLTVLCQMLELCDLGCYWFLREPNPRVKWKCWTISEGSGCRYVRTWIWPTKVLLKVVSAGAHGDQTSFMQW